MRDSLVCLALLAGCFPALDPKLGGDDTGRVDGDGDGVYADDDCDDADASIGPGAEERCNGIDDDCDGEIDEGVGDIVYVDADGDGWGDPATETTACEPEDGLVGVADDCDDTDPDVNPGAVEACNGVDDDCDGVADDGPSIWYADADGDGWGDADTPVEGCDEPTGAVAQAGDCDDRDPTAYPDAPEVCDGVDDDCDGVVDEDVLEVWYRDADGDGYGGLGDTASACEAPSGYVDNVDDCDDSEAAVHPGATEVCNAVDDDCDGDIDDADLDLDTTTAATFYEDDDGDGFGDAGSPRLACAQPSDAVADATDCDDSDSAVNPDATEVCNGVDDDCDGAADDADGSLDTTTATTWYDDADADGYGDAGAGTTACVQPSGTVADATDCDDDDAAISPAATEVCNGEDDDCNGDIDDDDAGLDASTASTWYADLDLDGYGDGSDTLVACDEPSGYTDDDSDCDDDDVDVNPGASEDCNGIDDDCDGTADSTAVCPCDVEYRSGATDHPYMFCTNRKNWTDARDECDDYDYVLVTIDDTTENSWLDTTADSYSTSEWWIGYNDRSTEGTWVWESGATSTFTNWRSGQPDNYRNEDCAEINRWHPSLDWNDIGCGDRQRFVCEAP